MKAAYVIQALTEYVEEYGDQELFVQVASGTKGHIQMPVRSLGWDSIHGLHVGADILDSDRDARIVIKRQRKETA